MLKFRLSNGAAITGRGITAIAGAAIAIGACGEITGPVSHSELPVSAGISAQAVPTVLSTSPANGETGVRLSTDGIDDGLRSARMGRIERRIDIEGSLQIARCLRAITERAMDHPRVEEEECVPCAEPKSV